MGVGPILIFDKSALQGLSVDESVMLDQFFLVNLTPVFLIETLADLQKVDPKGRSSEAVVRNLADKTPDHPYPNVFHRTLLIQDFLGYPVALTGQIHLAAGVAKPDGAGGISVVVPEPPEADMVRRWQAGEFKEIERLYARTWRVSLTQIDFSAKIEMARRLVPADQRVTTLEEAKAFADGFVGTPGREIVTFAQQFLDIPDEHVGAIDRRYTSARRPPLSAFAPYAAFVLSLDLVFYLGMSINQIGHDRRTNVIDLSYLYYLPFCMVFTSQDKLHRRLAPMFMRPRQRFVRAEDLKAALRAANEHYSQFREEIEDKGLTGFTHQPPADMAPLIRELWDHCMRLDGPAESEDGDPGPGPESEELLERIKAIEAAEPLATGTDLRQPDSIILHGRMSPRRGSWRILRRGIENEPIPR